MCVFESGKNSSKWQIGSAATILMQWCARCFAALRRREIDLNLAATHALREGQGGGSPQRRRSTDGATAWRRDVDYEYHLHYWECPGGIVELASMGPHNDFSIPE